MTQKAKHEILVYGVIRIYFFFFFFFFFYIYIYFNFQESMVF
jgi:hypothetical protein